MAERTVSVKLVADARAYIQGMDEMSRKTKDATQTVEQQLAAQRDAFNTVGVAAVAVGTAIVGIGVAALNTGISYNTLQQTSRAALETLLGSAEAANAQMDKLDEFARTSPFAKSVFIEAQQQLLGFGTAAEDVVPILDAIQNAVAATGGSNQDIAELTRIIAQLEGGVRLSAETFNQFGARGIDAAQLIGDAMGKTGAEIRESVTAGTLDADDAIRALTEGMAARFDGAAEGVKDTFEGAMDRVKAAWRDFASDLATPLVDPNGGGALIDLLNWAADAMRAFEALPEPVKLTATAIGGLTGVVALVGGGALLAVPQLATLKTALDTLGVSAGVTSGAMSALGIAGVAGLAIGGLAALGIALENTRPPASAFADAIRDGASSVELLHLANDGLANSLDGFEYDTTNTSSIIEQNQRIQDSMFATFDPANWGAYFSDYSSRTRQIGEGLAELADTDLPAAVDAFLGLAEAQGLSAEETAAYLEDMPAFLDSWSQASSAAGESVSVLGLVRDAQAGITLTSAEAADGIAGVGDASATAAEQAQALLDAQQSLVDAFFAAQDAMAGYEQTVDDIADALTEGLTPAVTENGEAFDLGEQSGRDAAGMLSELVTSAQGASEAMRDNGASAGEMAGYQAEARQRVYDTGIELGLSSDAARDYANRLLEVPSNVSTDVQVNTGSAERTISAFVNQRRVVNIEVRAGAMPSLANQRGVVQGYAGGGRIPGPFLGRDDRLGFTSSGNIVGLAGDEWIINPASSSKYDALLRQINDGTLPGYASGGRISNPVYQPSFNPVIQVAAPTAGVSRHLTQHVHPAPGMSELAFADKAQAAEAWAWREN